jgi:hypothetical protein
MLQCNMCGCSDYTDNNNAQLITCIFKNSGGLWRSRTHILLHRSSAAVVLHCSLGQLVAMQQAYA